VAIAEAPGEGTAPVALLGFLGDAAPASPTEFRIYPGSRRAMRAINTLRGSVEIEGASMQPAALRPSPTDRYLVAKRAI
jgi:hypothetical protein